MFMRSKRFCIASYLLLYLVGLASRSLGSIVLTTSEGQIAFSSDGLIEITLAGCVNGDFPFEFRAFANRTVNYPNGYFAPNALLLPTFNASGIDLRNYSLTINGSAMPIGSESLAVFGPGSFIEANGAGIPLPTPALPDVTVSGPVNFNLEFNLYEAGAIGYVDPIYTISSTGAGTAKFMAAAILDNGPPYFEIMEGMYTLLPAVTCTQGNAVPEPKSIALWAIMGLFLASPLRPRAYSC